MSSSDLLPLLLGALDDLGLHHTSVGCQPTTPRVLRDLNRDFAGSDRTTDVLAFPALDSTDPSFTLPESEVGFLGDIYISVETALAQAVAGPEEEIRLLAVHGLLHLLGHDHLEPGGAAQMTRLTRDLLARDAARRGLPPPQVPQLQPMA
ncbi:MAG: rRNA maturation RNase YbeY [Candidatus Dormibacteria bacterium]